MRAKVASRFATQRSVSQRIAGFLAVYFWVWLPITTPGVSGAGRGTGAAPAPVPAAWSFS